MLQILTSREPFRNRGIAYVSISKRNSKNKIRIDAPSETIEICEEDNIGITNTTKKFNFDSFFDLIKNTDIEKVHEYEEAIENFNAERRKYKKVSLIKMGICVILGFSIAVLKANAAEQIIVSEEDILEEQRLGELELLAQLVEAEAGNQDLTGKCYVVDVVMNRVDSDEFPNTIEEVIFQDMQFSVILDGAFDRAGWYISDESFEAVKLESDGIRLNDEILYFGTEKSVYADNHFKYQDHWFGW